MSCKELKTFHWTCDRCPATGVSIAVAREYAKPPGWGGAEQIDARGYKYLDLCSLCYARQQAVDKERLDALFAGVETRLSNDLFHKLWSKAVGQPDYDKTEWLRLELLLLQKKSTDSSRSQG